MIKGVSYAQTLNLKGKQMTKPNLNLLNEMALGIYEIEKQDTLRKIPLNKIKAAKETFFKRKPDAKAVYVINHYNKGEKTYSCSDYETGREIFLKSTTPVFVGFEY